MNIRVLKFPLTLNTVILNINIFFQMWPWSKSLKLLLISLCLYHSKVSLKPIHLMLIQTKCPYLSFILYAPLHFKIFFFYKARLIKTRNFLWVNRNVYQLYEGWALWPPPKLPFLIKQGKIYYKFIGFIHSNYLIILKTA